MITKKHTVVWMPILLLLVGSGFGDSWHTETVDTDGAGSHGTSIAVDNSGYVHISYNGEGGFLEYARQMSSSWQLELIDYTGGWYSSIALTESGYPYISYQNPDDFDLEYAWVSGSGWVTDNVDTDTNVGLHTSIALDSNEYPHISYSDFPNERLKYARWNGSSWELELIYNGHFHGFGSSLALDSNDYPRISHYCWFYDDGLRCDWWNGSSWEEATLDGAIGTPANSAWSTSIALDGNDYTCIAYYDGEELDLEYVMWNGSSWQYVSVDTTGSVGGYASLALDSNDYPHISYYDESNGDLKYARWDGSSWQIESVDTEGDVGGWTSIALDSSDIPHISYYSFSDGLLRYAYFIPTETENSTEQAIMRTEMLPISPNPSGGAPAVRFSVSESSLIGLAVFDLSGRKILDLSDEEYASGYHSIVLDGLSPGIYFCRMVSDGLPDVQCFVVTD